MEKCVATTENGVVVVIMMKRITPHLSFPFSSWNEMESIAWRHNVTEIGNHNNNIMCKSIKYS